MFSPKSMSNLGRLTVCISNLVLNIGIAGQRGTYNIETNLKFKIWLLLMMNLNQFFLLIFCTQANFP